MSKATEALAALNNPTISDYLDLMADTESPPIYHAWALISAASACMTRRCWFQMGPIRIMPNQFVMLVGAPGVRKSTAVAFGKSLVEDIHGMRFAPNSTGGHMQGLITAMQGRPAKADDEAINETLDAMGGINFGALTQAEEDALSGGHIENRHAIYVSEGELTSFIGMKRDDFTNFLGDQWDKSGSAEYTYQLKRERVAIPRPCLNMIGGITPKHITTYLPPQAIGQGFTSRIIMVYSEENRQIPWPEPIDEKRLAEFKRLLLWIFDTKEGPFEYTLEAKQAVKDLYSYKIKVEDARFIHYGARRQTHMLKVAMALCALRADNTITSADILDAHNLLCLTELDMAEALGDFGLSPLALAKSRVAEVLKNATFPQSLTRIITAAGSDVSQQDVRRALYEMEQIEQIVEVTLVDRNGIERTGYVWPMEANPFKRNAKISVDYLLAEVDGPRGKARGSAVATVADQLEIEAGEQVQRQTRVDYAALPVAARQDDETVGTLASQGHASIAAKLAAFLLKRDGGHK